MNTTSFFPSSSAREKCRLICLKAIRIEYVTNPSPNYKAVIISHGSANDVLQVKWKIFHFIPEFTLRLIRHPFFKVLFASVILFFVIYNRIECVKSEPFIANVCIKGKKTQFKIFVRFKQKTDEMLKSLIICHTICGSTLLKLLRFSYEMHKKRGEKVRYSFMLWPLWHVICVNIS